MKNNLIIIGCCLLALYCYIPSAFCQDRKHLEHFDNIKTPAQDGSPASNFKNRSRLSTLRQMQVIEDNDIMPVQQQSNILSSKMEVNRYNPDANWKELGPFKPAEHLNNVEKKYYETNHASTLSLNIAPYDPNVMWVSTYGSGIWKTWNGGQSWIPISRNSLPGSEIAAFAVDPYNPNMLYATVDAHYTSTFGLYKTTDGGGNWWKMQNLSSPLSSIIIHPKQNQKILTGNRANIYYSENSGATWTTVLTGYNFSFFKLQNSNNQPDVVYAQVSDNMGARVVKSTDFGKTWQNTGLINLFPSNIRQMDIAVAPTDANMVYVVYTRGTSTGTETRILRSTDGGGTWTNQSEGFQNVATFFLKITVDSDNKNKLYLSLNNELDGVYVSSDGGATLGMIGTSIKPFSSNPTGLYVSDMKHHPISKELICSFHFGGIFKVKTANLSSVDIHELNCPTELSRAPNVSLYGTPCISLNNQWTRISDGISATPVFEIAKKDNVVLASTECGFFKWDGNSWMKIVSTFTTYNAAFLGNKNSFYFDDGYSFTKSIDGGLTLTNVLQNEALFETAYYRSPIYVNAANSNVAYNLRTNIWKTTDGGNNWTKIVVPKDTNNRFIAGAAMGIAPSNESVMYVASFGSGRLYIFKTTNGGTSWQNVRSNLPFGYVDRMLVHPTNPNQVWLILQGGGVYSTSDGGNNWVNITAGIPTANTSFRAIAFDAVRNVLYIGTADAGVFIKSANDSQFRPYNVGLPYISVFDLEIDQNEGKIYAGTGAGVWVGDLYDNSPNTNAAMRQENRVQKSPFVALHPNPVANSLTVGINAPLKSEWQVRLLNNLGQVAYIYSGRETQRFDINIKSFSNGLYFLEYTEGGNRKVEKVIVQH